MGNDMPIDEKDFYTMQAHLQYQDEKLGELKKDVEAMAGKLDVLLEHMHQRAGSTRMLVFFSGLFGAILAGVSEYILYYVLQK